MPETKKAVRKTGSNVQAFIAREDELKIRHEAVQLDKAKEIYSVWEQAAVRNQAAKARQRLNEGRFEEMRQLEVEVKVRRNAKLKAYYKQQDAIYEERLRAKGLAYLKETA